MAAGGGVGPAIVGPVVLAPLLPVCCSGSIGLPKATVVRKFSCPKPVSIHRVTQGHRLHRRGGEGLLNSTIQRSD